MAQNEGRLAANEPFVVTRDLSLGDLRMKAYEGVTLTLEKGRAHAICAQDKGGKSELLLTLAGLMKPSSGTCVVAGCDVAPPAGRHAVRKLASLAFFEHVNDVERVLKVRTIAAAELGLAGKPSHRGAARAFLERWGLGDAADRIIEDLPRLDYDLLGIALAMAHDPQLLVVDDIESGLTEHEMLKLRDLLVTLAHERGVTVVCGVLDYDLAAGFDSASCITAEAAAQQSAYQRKHMKIEVA